jgi:hypothetical protein
MLHLSVSRPMSPAGHAVRETGIVPDAQASDELRDGHRRARDQKNRAKQTGTGRRNRLTTIGADDNVPYSRRNVVQL